MNPRYEKYIRNKIDELEARQEALRDEREELTEPYHRMLNDAAWDDEPQNAFRAYQIFGGHDAEEDAEKNPDHKKRDFYIKNLKQDPVYQKLERIMSRLCPSVEDIAAKKRETDLKAYCLVSIQRTNMTFRNMKEEVYVMAEKFSEDGLLLVFYGLANPELQEEVDRVLWGKEEVSTGIFGKIVNWFRREAS